MPRKKPEALLKIRNMRLCDEHYTEFIRRGGAVWLREELSRANKLPTRSTRPALSLYSPKPKAKPMGANSIFNFGASL